MLQSIRDNITGWIAWVVVILLSVPFALFGINTYFEGRFSNDVARVNGQEITNQDFRQRYQNQYQQIRQMFGDQFDPDMIDEERMRRDVLDQMIKEELLVQRAEDQRYRVSEEEIIREIQSFEAFHQDGQFSIDRYRALLRAQGMSPAMLERRVERDKKSRLLEQAIASSAFATDHEVRRLAALENQQREFSEVRLAMDDFMAVVEVSDAEVSAYYEANADQFMTEEQVDLEYIQLSLDEIREQIEISEEELRAAWEEDRESYMADEERYSRHILFAIENNEEDAAREKAEALAERIRDGESFEDLAREYSDDPVSGQDGGSLGWVMRGDMVDAVDNVIFSLEAGELSDVVRSEFGYHLVRVDEIETPEPMPFEEARDELLSDMREREGERRYYDMRETLGDESFAHPDDLNYIAELLDLDIREQAGVSQDAGEGIASHSRVRRDAFSELVLTDRLNSDPIELDGDRVVVIRVVEHRPSEQRPLEEVAADIRERLKGEKALAQAEERAQALLAKLRDGVALDALSDNGSYQVEGPRTLSRDDSDVDSRLREQLFRMPRPDNGPVVEQIRRGDGDLALLILHGVDSRMLADLGEDELRQRKSSFGQEIARSEFNFYVREMRRNADVEVLVDTDDEEEVFGR